MPFQLKRIVTPSRLQNVQLIEQSIIIDPLPSSTDKAWRWEYRLREYLLGVLHCLGFNCDFDFGAESANPTCSTRFEKELRVALNRGQLICMLGECLRGSCSIGGEA